MLTCCSHRVDDGLPVSWRKWQERMRLAFSSLSAEETRGQRPPFSACIFTFYTKKISASCHPGAWVRNQTSLTPQRALLWAAPPLWTSGSSSSGWLRMLGGGACSPHPRVCGVLCAGPGQLCAVWLGGPPLVSQRQQVSWDPLDLVTRIKLGLAVMTLRQHQPQELRGLQVPPNLCTKVTQPPL